MAFFALRRWTQQKKFVTLITPSHLVPAAQPNPGASCVFTGFSTRCQGIAPEKLARASAMAHGVSICSAWVAPEIVSG
jgi:hypothetical protein